MEYIDIIVSTGSVLVSLMVGYFLARWSYRDKKV